MSSLTIELPSQQEQTALNLRRWAEVLADPEMRKIEGRIETDRHGHVLMSPPAAASHGRYQSRINILLDRLMTDGEALTECPISTADGVRAADVVWASKACIRGLGGKTVFTRAPEICVEVLSPDNRAAEIREKTALYFDAGAKEVWLCSLTGKMTFFVDADRELPRSALCPEFPAKIELR